jgi:REP element-mobilizing transposase RayT
MGQEMTLPREIHPGRFYFVTRRCTQRQFLLRPDEKTTAIFEYCLAEAARRYEVALVAWLAMSNHYHAVVFDPHGQLPAFLEHLHKMVAKALNARWSRWENLWATEETCVVYLPTPRDVFDKTVYTLTNPVSDHLVERASDWPGSSSLRFLVGRRASRHARPRTFFRATGVMPEWVELRAASPPVGDLEPGGRRGEAEAAWAERVLAAVADRERAAREERARAGTRVRGRRAVRMASAFESPQTSEPRRNLRPAVACKDPARRAAELVKLVAFRRRYAAARARFVAGERSVEFPAGTYRLRAWGVRCAPSPPSRF